MAAKEKLLEDPELGPSSGSEIEAVIDMTAIGADGIMRPVFINQCDAETLALTLEDAERLLGFLKKAVVFVRESKYRILQ